MENGEEWFDGMVRRLRERNELTEEQLAEAIKIYRNRYVGRDSRIAWKDVIEQVKKDSKLQDS